jgi:cytochrome c5
MEKEMKRAILVVVGAMAASLSMGQAAAADGKAVYDKTCAGCHAAMPPKLGDKAAFQKLKKDAAAASVVKGKGAMPPKGGAASDADAKAAVDYMFSQAK